MHPTVHVLGGISETPKKRVSPIIIAEEGYATVCACLGFRELTSIIILSGCRMQKSCSWPALVLDGWEAMVKYFRTWQCLVRVSCSWPELVQDGLEENAKYFRTLQCLVSVSCPVHGQHMSTVDVCEAMGKVLRTWLCLVRVSCFWPDFVLDDWEPVGKVFQYKPMPGKSDLLCSWSAIVLEGWKAIRKCFRSWQCLESVTCPVPVQHLF